MSAPNIPLHLTLTGRPILLYPNVIPEMAGHLQNAYTERGSRLANRAFRRKAKKAKAPEPLAARAPATRLALADHGSANRREPFIEVVSISGPLLNKADYFGDMLCVDGYDRIEAEISRAIHDPDCQGVLLDIDSPGGMVSGCFELHDKIAEMAKTKPIVAFSAGMICSAAYSIAAACTEIHGQMSAIIGSIGVVYGRLDATAFNDKNGLKIDFIKSGEQKVWGNPETKMEDAELAAHQSEVMKLAGWFFDRVAAGRGLSVDAVSNFEAGVFLTDDAITNGLADSVTDFAGAISRLTELASPPSSEVSAESVSVDTPAADSKPSSKPSGVTAPKAPAAAAAKPSTKNKETPMSKLTNARHRASLAVTTSALAFAMAGNMAESENLNDETLKKAVEEETEETLDAMTDEDVAAMDGEDTEAMEDDEDITAMDDEEMKKVEDDEDSTTVDAVKATASSVARRAVAKASAIAAPSAPAASKSDDPVAAERARVSAIMGLPEAKGRESLAQTLATSEHGHSVDAARELLAASPKANARTFAPAQPKVGTGGGGASGGKATAFDAAQKASAAAMRKRVGQN